MIVAVVTSSPPFAEGGHLVIARSLVTALREAGHGAELVVTPQHRFGRQASAYLATWMRDVRRTADGRAIDRVVSFRYPSYAVRHPAHVCWLNHRMREYYDLWERFRPTLSAPNRLKEGVRRRAIHAVDRYLLTRNVRRLFAQSRTIQARLQRFGSIRSEVLYPPAPPRSYRCDGYGDVLFAVSRLTPLKRLDLLVRALALPAAAGVRCVIAGDGEEAGRLRHLVDELGLAARVSLIGAVGPSELVDHLARCRAVCFPPLDEDFGLVTVEAFASAKPVITCRDSGGPAELVRDGVDGLVCDPTPAAVASAIGELMGDAARAERMGCAARDAAASLTWPETIDRLFDPRGRLADRGRSSAAPSLSA
jgi:glycosyltransferase involved in cell wall biosynthesis